MKTHEPAIDSIVPYDGYLFQITAVASDHGINRPHLDALMKAGIFVDFFKRNPNKSVRFVWVMERNLTKLSKNKVITKSKERHMLQVRQKTNIPTSTNLFLKST
jgi:hypothetical protein